MDANLNKNSKRAPKVSLEESFPILNEYVDLLPQERSLLPGPTQPIWKEISERFQGKWSARDVYRECKENRKGLWTKLHPGNNSNTTDGNLNSSSSQRTSINTTINTSFDDEDWEAPNLDNFEVDISEEMFHKLREQEPANYKGIEYSVLQRWAWTDYIAEEFFKVSESRCAFVFKNAKIHSNGAYYLTIQGKCKSTKCSNPFYGILDSEPVTFPAKLRVRCRDTVFDLQHEDVRRPVRKLKRAKIGQEGAAIGASNWLKKEVSTLGTRRIPPLIPLLPVVQKCVNEFRDKELGVKEEDKKDVIKAIEKMRYSHKYSNFIRDIKKDNFYVFYGSNVQLHAYKRYHYLMKLKKQKSSIAIDGTGSLCKKLVYENGRISGHIFLYVIVINFNHFTLPVFQLLTDDQSTILLEFWLKYWIRMGAPKPDEATCDYSRALINALMMTFNEQTTKTYIETLFLDATKNPLSKMRPPISTKIRIDVAHFIKMITRWGCIKTIENNQVRKFYLFCVALLIDAQTIKEFEIILKSLCTVCLNKHNDTILQNGKSVESVRKDLENMISNHSYDLIDELLETTSDETNSNTEEENCELSSVIKDWVHKVKESSTEIHQEGEEVNGFYNKTFIGYFFKTLVAEFPLWSSACLRGTQDHATTSHVEAYFGDLKHRVLKNYKNQRRVDKFLRIAYLDLQGGSAIFNTHLLNDFQGVREKYKNDIADELHCPPEQTSEKMQTVEKKINYPDDNWKNKSKKRINDFDEPIEEIYTEHLPKKQKMGAYFQDQPSISYVNSNVSSKITLKKMKMLKNGNLVRAVLIDKTHYDIRNTCGFDSIVQIIATAMVDDARFLAFAAVEEEKCAVFKFITQFIKPTTRMNQIYKERAKLLLSRFSAKKQTKNSKTEKTPKCPLFPEILDMESSIAEVWSKCFSECPSAFDTFNCKNCVQYTINVPTIIIGNQKSICSQGYEALSSTLNEIPMQFESTCQKCGSICQVNRIYNQHVFVELEIADSVTSGMMSSKLLDFEKSVNFSSNNYSFSLKGVVAHTPGHFQAYIRRGNERWERHNDLEDEPAPAKSTTTILPSAVIFIRDN